MKHRQSEFTQARVHTEAEMAVQGVQKIDEALVRDYVADLRQLLESSEITQRKAFLKSFLKRIEIDGQTVTMHYTLPMPPDGKHVSQVTVPPIDTFGGEGGIRTPTP